MKKRAIFLIVLIIIFGVGISFFMYFPKSIENALNRIKYPFEVGEILASQQIDENLTAVIYTNKEEKSNLQNAIVRKRGVFSKGAGSGKGEHRREQFDHRHLYVPGQNAHGGPGAV